MRFPLVGLRVSIALLIVGCLASSVIDAAAQLREVATSSLTAGDGTTFEVTSVFVRVAEGDTRAAAVRNGPSMWPSFGSDGRAPPA